MKPEGFHTVTPYLILAEPAKAIDWYKQALGAVELMRQVDDAGSIRHAQIRVGDSPLMIGGESPEYPDYQSPLKRGGSTVHFYLYVDDPDAVFAAAVSAGAKVLSAMTDQWYGDRVGGVVDPFGHVWYIATQIAK